MTLSTAKQLAKDLREPTNRVEYLIRKFNIEPATKVGGIRVFGDAQQEIIKGHLSKFKSKA